MILLSHREFTLMYNIIRRIERTYKSK